MPVFATATEVAYFESRWQLADAFSELKKDNHIFKDSKKYFLPELKKIIIFSELKKDYYVFLSL